MFCAETQVNMNAAMNVTCTVEREMTRELDRGILELQQKAFPHVDIFAHQRWYESPLSDDELWFTTQVDGGLVGSVRLLHREIITEEANLLIAGIGNVCSHPEQRGSGAAKACMQATADYIGNGGKVDFGLLFCHDPVRDFYAKLDWKEIDNAISTTGAEGQKVPLIGRNTMIYPGKSGLNDWPGGPIDLNGNRW